MQEMVGGDYNRTPINFWVPDIYRFVGAVNGFLTTILAEICESDRRF